MGLSRTLLLTVIAAAALCASGCMTTYYTNPQTPGFSIQTGRDTTDFGDDQEAGKGHTVQPWVLAACLAHESTNVPFYYERIASWQGNPPTHFVVQTPMLMTEFNARRSTAEALLRKGLIQTLVADTDPKKDKFLYTGRVFAATVGLDTWLHCGEALFEKGYARYGWGHKPELNSDKMNVAGFMFHVSINPDAQTVSIRTSERDLAGGFGVVPKTCVFDVSKVKMEITTKDGRKVKVGAFDWVDVDGNNLATEATYEEIGDWDSDEVEKNLAALMAKMAVIPPDVVAKGLKYLGEPDSVRK